MPYLLDTQILIWSVIDRKKISKEILILLENVENEIFVSQFSLQEIAIK